MCVIFPRAHEHEIAVEETEEIVEVANEENISNKGKERSHINRFIFLHIFD